MRLSGKIVGAVLSMRNHLDKRVLHRAWTTKPSDRESAFPDAVELVNHPTGYKGLQIRGEQLGPLRGQPGPAAQPARQSLRRSRARAVSLSSAHDCGRTS